MGLFQVGDGQLRVVLDGIERLVAEELFDVVHAGAGAEHLCGPRPPERMGGDVDVDPGLLRTDGDHAAQRELRQPIPSCAQRNFRTGKL